MKYYIIAGEASGDLHGSNLMKGIYAEDPQADIRFWGGDCMNSVWSIFQDNPSPCGQGGSTVLETSPLPLHAVSAPETDIRLRVLCINAFHQVRTVKVT
jgi:hypothetical protein